MITLNVSTDVCLHKLMMYYNIMKVRSCLFLFKQKGLLVSLSPLKVVLTFQRDFFLIVFWETHF